MNENPGVLIINVQAYYHAILSMVAFSPALTKLESESQSLTWNLQDLPSRMSLWIGLPDPARRARTELAI